MRVDNRTFSLGGAELERATRQGGPFILASIVELPSWPARPRTTRQSSKRAQPIPAIIAAVGRCLPLLPGFRVCQQKL